MGLHNVLVLVSLSPTASQIDREIKDMRGDLLGGVPFLSYLRYNLTLSEKEVRDFLPDLPSKTIASLGQMDNPANLDVLLTLGETTAERQVVDTHFPPHFDLME